MIASTSHQLEVSVTKQQRTLITAITVLADSIAAAMAFYGAYILRLAIPLPTSIKLGPFSSYALLGIMHVLVIVVTFFFSQLYHRNHNQSRIDLFSSIVSAVSVATVVDTAASMLASSGIQLVSRGIILYTWALTIVLVVIDRAIVSKLASTLRRRHPERLILVGTGELARVILQKTVQSAHLGYQVVGFVDANTPLKDIAGVPVLGTPKDLERIIREQEATEVIIALLEPTHADLLDMIADCAAAKASVRILPDMFQIMASQVSIGDLEGLPMLIVRDIALDGWKLAIKRAMDIIVSGVGLVIISPLLFAIALAVKLDSPGPVLYTQVRVGLDGKPFGMLKFRSMRVDAESDTGPVWATKDDPRKTRLGAFLRKTSLDELPQLINVLIGDMSLVGPRPERPVFVEQFKQVVPRYMERHMEKGGMTGWAQVNGLRGETSIIERTKYDLYYIENWSILFDIKIILRTIFSILRGGKNAY